jgi:hypothetical protein
VPKHDDTTIYLAAERESNRGDEPQRIRLTTRLSPPAYDALAEIQRRHRRKTGRAIAKWRVIDRAIIAYAKREGIYIEG